jgi:hypothetical protein
MDSDSRTVDQDEGREDDRGSILRRIEEKLDRLLGSGDDDWHEREWAPPDSPFAPYGPGSPRPSFIAPADTPGWDPSLAGPRFDDPVPSFDDAQPLAARSSAREYYLLMRARQQRRAAAGYADYRRRKNAELDREYGDYCRDQQACFDRDFEAWRQKRSGPPAPVEEPARQETAGEDEAKRR